MRTTNDEKTKFFTVRCSENERELIDRVRHKMDDRLSASALVFELVREKAQQLGIITIVRPGVWEFNDMGDE